MTIIAQQLYILLTINNLMIKMNYNNKTRILTTGWHHTVLLQYPTEQSSTYFIASNQLPFNVVECFHDRFSSDTS